MSLFPTPFRLTLLDRVAAGTVQYGIGPDGSPTGPRRAPAAWDVSDPHRGPQKVTAAITEMATAGWVERPDRSAVWRLTRLGRAVHSVRLMDYGTHAVAETGPVDEPTYLGIVEGDPNRPSRWLARVGPDTVAGLRRPAAVAALHRLAVAAVVAMEADALDGAA
ncbi:hypothetical protein [Micromonospora sp. WMMD980]|uniref:hypothetical protein n=1 Tax=Micromonospora sp. WMMD980 TaxID=3016088 RepID=UPI0024160FFF|nr:hypothetical protein [Micromonospora sp. WMMD980]MDG4798952.1 hypothetical protein [Micromonospora sp. WMMD980]MDG4798975.1 hypothetical protein [Micromonospora sp. WMMD980]MDG4799018.1 hypothetical protein [Micromonospora sp. WMMD980]